MLVLPPELVVVLVLVVKVVVVALVVVVVPPPPAVKAHEHSYQITLVSNYCMKNLSPSYPPWKWRLVCLSKQTPTRAGQR